MWPCYGVHITVCVARLVFVLCQPEHSWIEPSLHGLDFLLEIFYGELFLFFFDNNLLLRGTAHVIAVDASSAHVSNWLMASFMLCPLSLPWKIAGVRSQLCSKQSSKGISTENFLATGDFFECNFYRVTALSCLKKERRGWTILTFDCFRFATLK